MCLEGDYLVSYRFIFDSTNSISLLDMISWGAVGILAQIIVFYLAEWLTPRFNINKSLEEDNQAVGLFLMFYRFQLGL